MKAQGFTLIELLAVLMLLAAIFMVSFPTLINTAKEDKQKEFDIMEKTLCEAGRTYMYSDIESFPTLSTINSVVQITISELNNNDLVDISTINPETEETIENGILEYTVQSDYSLDCHYSEE